ncbi:MAG: hypothetical protein KDI37_04170 [Xanthomonadales bacterium]|nr:hypothetical protein [Xanthomonadales bacterium]
MATSPPPDLADRIQRGVVWLLVAVMAIEAIVAGWLGRWLQLLVVLAVMGLTLAPLALSRRFAVHVPPQFQVLVIAFVFAALYLGEVRGYYTRYWWWDIALHTSSGALLGILGFLLVYVLNENRRIDLHLSPGFVALFAFGFALAAGALWEIFEFSMDKLVGTRMQKPMLGDLSGLTDTMWDLIVDALGALLAALYGWRYLRRGQRSLLRQLIERFVSSNPRLFRRG